MALGACEKTEGEKMEGEKMEGPKVRWKMQSAFGSKLPHLGTSGVRFSENITKLSAGTLEIKFHEPNALVPALECFDAISKGSLESCWTTAPILR